MGVACSTECYIYASAARQNVTMIAEAFHLCMNSFYKMLLIKYLRIITKLSENRYFKMVVA